MARVDSAANELQTAAVGDRPWRRGAVRLWSERGGIILIVLGIVGLIQPWVQGLYTDGFPLLLIGTLIFIVASHL